VKIIKKNSKEFMNLIHEEREREREMCEVVVVKYSIYRELLSG
jgi:hypothetical protein